MSYDYDVIVIGSGVAGLTCASLLAKEGLKVLVLERLNRVGGLCSTYDRGDGYKADTGAVWIVPHEPLLKLFELLDKRMEDYIDLQPIDPVYHMNFGEGKEYVLPRDFEGMADVIAGISPPDVANYRRYCRDMKKVYDIYMAFITSPMPDILRVKNLSSWAKMGAKKELIPAIPPILKLAMTSADNLSRKYFKEPLIQYLFGWECVLTGQRSNRTRSFFAIMPYLSRTGYYYPVGGTITVPLALQRIAEEYGAEVRLSTDVESIVIENGKAKGVRIRQGVPAGASECRWMCGLPYPCDRMSKKELPAASETLTARVVLSNAHARVTYLDLVGKDNLPGWATRTVRRQPVSMATPATIVGLSEKMESIKAQFSMATNFKMGESGIWSYQFTSLWNDFYDRGVLYSPMDGFYFIIDPGCSDPGSVPTGKQVLTIHYMGPYKLAHHNWDDIADEWSWEIINHLDENYYPGIAQRIEWMDSVPPNEMERRFNLPEGGFLGLPLLGISNMGPFRPRHRSRMIGNLYLTGHSTNPGASVPLVMISGMLTSSLILNDWRDNS